MPVILSEVRDFLEAREEQLSPYAAKSRLSKGRQRPEEPSPVRTEFQRDRDRIIHCKAFRRLKHKTQVFIAPQGDHYVTRLTHTLEVSQIARTIARALNLNEDLTEAITLGHDLGHPPFGHAAEEVLAGLFPEGFRHNEQSIRVVEVLEKNGEGLNLTWEVREGILKHSKPRQDILAEGWGTATTLEGQISKIADSIAYINHDIGDAIRAGMISEEELPSGAIMVLGASHARRINTLVCDIIETSWSVSGRDGSLLAEKPTITLSAPVLQAANELREFLFQRVYLSEAILHETQKAKEVVLRLYERFSRHPEKLPIELRKRDDSVARKVVDYIAGMTDLFALRCFDEISKPRLWAGI